MARKVLNRKELRAEAEAAEASGTKKKAAKKKTATRRKTKKKTDEPVRLKAYWGVFSQSLKCVAKFEYNERKAADKKADDLSGSGKSPHFVRLLKEPLEEP